MTSHNLPGGALAVLLSAMLVLRVSGKWVLSSGMSRLPGGRISSVNLVGTPRGSVQPPKVWLVAHLDSKSQTIPMLVRIGSVALSVLFCVVTVGVLIAIVGLDVAGIAQPMGPHDSRAMAVAWMSAFLGAVTTIPLIVCFIGNRSNGAVDNATGVASVALALELIRDREKVGVIVTSGEELGLAGAEAFASQTPTKGIALNCDTIDDNGRFICMASGGMPKNLANALDRAAQRTGIVVSKRRMLLGILADNIAFTGAGWDSFTLSRGNLRTLARVHTSRDRAEAIDGTGIAMAAQLLAATAEELS
jgi:Peptidase family M28